jgi:integrase/recombinase XerD
LLPLRFLYTTTLHKEWRLDEILPSPQKPDTAVVLSPEEVLQFLDSAEHIKHRTILTTCYAAGLGIGEAVLLKPNHVDSQRRVIAVK